MKRKIKNIFAVSILLVGICFVVREAVYGFLTEDRIVVAAGENETGMPYLGDKSDKETVSSEPYGESDKETVSMGTVSDNKPEAGAMAANMLLGNDLAANIVFGNEVFAETETISENTALESEYANFAIADVEHYVNVRNAPDTEGEIVGKIYDGAVAQILSSAGENGEWFQIISGSVEGYIKAEFFIYGDAAAAVIDDYVTRYAVVQADRLNVRKEPDTLADRIGYLDNGEKVKYLEVCGEWVKVQYTENKTGYVSGEYVTLIEEFVYAKSMEEERAELEAQRLLAEREAISEQTAPENVITAVPSEHTEYADNAELRAAIVEYAMQYLGNVYVHGGKSLAEGTDCSGFTCFIYADFGYSISRTPQGQLSSAGRSIDYSEIQPGDIICYTSNGGKSCTHVGLYIGDGQIIHAANSRKGVITGEADYSTIMGVKNVID